MNLLGKTFTGWAVATALLLAMPATQAATYNYTITGQVLAGNEFGDANAYNLQSGDTVTATGTFTANLGTIGSETGTVFFGATSGNSMTISLYGTNPNTTSYLYASNDDRSGSDTGPFLTFNSGNLTDFDFLETGAPSFNSYSLVFDDFGYLVGQWTNASLTVVPTVVPVPAAVWLFGSGLLGLAGIARSKKSGK